MAKYRTFEEYVKGEKIIRYLPTFRNCWEFARESVDLSAKTQNNNTNGEICSDEHWDIICFANCGDQHGGKCTRLDDCKPKGRKLLHSA